MAMHALPQDTVRLIKSTQVITTPASIVKELVENSLDAEAKAISIKMEDHGFSRLEVRDNGSGIDTGDVEFIAKPHYTSKITSFSDLASLTSYGFRGEAVSSLCAVADVTITTKTKTNAVGHIYSFDHQGNIKDKKPAATPNGTIIVISNLFKNVPVRRQFYRNPKRCREELKKVEDIVLAISLAVPAVHLTLTHGKANIIQKNPAQDIRTALMNTFPRVFKDLVSKVKALEDMQIEVHLPDPSHISNQSFSRATSDRLFILVNRRPVTHKAIEKLVKAHYSLKNEGNHGRYPVGVVALTVPLDAVDVNLEPNKNKVLLQEEGAILETLRMMLTELYGPVESTTRKSNGEKGGVVNTDITCTLSCISQPQEKINSCPSEKSQQPQSKFDSLNVGVEDILYDIEETENIFGPCVSNNVMTNKQFLSHARNSKGKTNFSCISHNSGTPDVRKTGNLVPRPSQLNTVIGVRENDNHHSIDKVNVGKTLQKMATCDSNKENNINVQKNLVTSTPGRETEALFPSAAESSIPQNGDRCPFEDTDDIFRVFISEDDDNSKSSETLKEHVPVNVPSSSLSSGSNSKKLWGKSKPETAVQVEGDYTGVDHRNSYTSSQSTQDSSHHHESLMGSDGIPVFKIAPLLQPDEVLVNNTGNQDSQDFIITQENAQETNFSLHNESTSTGVQALDAQQRLTPPKNNVEEEVRVLPQEDEEERQKASTNTGGSWSRGHISYGKNIQTVQLVNAGSVEVKEGKRKLSLGSGVGKRLKPPISSDIPGSQATPPKKPKINSLGPPSYDYIHGTPVKKPCSPFILFARDIRSQGMREEDELWLAFGTGKSFRYLAAHKMAACLGPEKARASPMFHALIWRIRESKGLNTSLNSPSNVRSMTKGSLDRYLAPLTPQMTKTNGKSVLKRQLESRRPWKDRSKEIIVTLEEVKKIIVGQKDNDSHSDSTMRLLGRLADSGGWLCVQDGSIMALNTYRLHETVLLDGLQNTFRLPVKDLKDSLPFNACTLGEKNWNVLLKLRREQVPNHNFYTVVDNRLTFSGFNIALYPGSSNNNQISHGEIIGMTDAIGFYGINDLKELLAVLATHPSSTIKQTRPLKFQYWIKGEAVRMIRSSPSIIRSEDVLEKLEKWYSIQQHLYLV
ncbi:PMS1 protein 1-like [Homarus americanus]|uniref:PMS1 protein 1-like n=1 Tax=Homarus americanus TaxID=6706 RepID=A0A8J5N1P9_HOMAM|nr:PMS1 protein 1-like [Homarus americanus]